MTEDQVPVPGDPLVSPIPVLHTPAERFAALPDYRFRPHHLEVDGTLVHYVDEGPSDATPVLLLHGLPTWSYLYRRIIPVLAAEGYRAVAPDLVGFGRSDKPRRRKDHTYQRHVDWMRRVVLALELHRAIMVCHDWGGLVGLRLATEHEDRFSAIVAVNVLFPTGDRAPGENFLRWQWETQAAPELRAGWIVDGGCVTELEPGIVAAYDAPFPDESYEAGPRELPMLIPAKPNDPESAPNRRVWDVLGRWEKPFVTLYSDSDPVFGGADRLFHQAVPGAKGTPNIAAAHVGRFLAEDRSELVVDAIVGLDLS